MVDPTTPGQTTWDTIAGAVVNPTAPDAPVGVTAGTGALDFSWECPRDGGAEITGFNLQWRATGGTYSAAIATTYARYLLTGLTNGTTYQARVQAITSFGSSGYGASGSATAQGTVPGGGATLALRATVGDTELTLDWLEPDDGGEAISGYDLQWRRDSQSFSSTREFTTTDTTYTHTGRTNGTEYFYRVRATNARGNGAWSNETSATPAEAGLAVDVPDRAAAMTGTAGQGEVLWFVNPPSDNGADITGYGFRFREVGAGTWTNRTLTAPVRLETGLTNGTQYEAQIRATNSQGTQSQYSPSGTATPAAEVPDDVQFVGLTNTTSGMDADWGAPENNGGAIINYRVQIDDNSGFNSPTSSTTTNTQRTFTGLSEGTTYYVRVRATNSAGNGGYSPTSSLSFSDLVSIPSWQSPTSEPTGTARRPLLIDWEFVMPNANGGRITSFDLQWRVSGNNWSGNIVNTATGCVTTTAPNANNAIEARVRARNSEGVGGWSGTGSVSAASLAAAVAITQRIPITSNQTYSWPYTDVVLCTYWNCVGQWPVTGMRVSTFCWGWQLGGSGLGWHHAMVCRTGPTWRWPIREHACPECEFRHITGPAAIGRAYRMGPRFWFVMMH